MGALSFQAYASELQVSLDLLDGTYVGESRHYYDTPFSDKPGFYHEKNSLEFGLGIKYIYDFEDWDLFGKFSIAQSELRNGNTAELGARYRWDDSHWFTAKFKGTYAKEQYEVDTQLIDPEHTNAVTNAEWAEWAIIRYRLNVNDNFYLGAEASSDLNNPALVEDDFSLFAGALYKDFIVEVKAGKELVFASFGMKFDLSSDEE